MKSIICFGEVLWDMLPAGKKLGGAPLNVALRAQSLGNNASMISSVGNDEIGVELVEEEARSGQSLSGGHLYQSAEHARPSEPDVVEKYEEHVGRTVRCRSRRRKIGFGIRVRRRDLCVGIPVLRLWVRVAVDRDRKAV